MIETRAELIILKRQLNNRKYVTTKILKSLLVFINRKQCNLRVHITNYKIKYLKLNIDFEIETQQK